jgi:hypothetical protein
MIKPIIKPIEVYGVPRVSLGAKFALVGLFATVLILILANIGVQGLLTLQKFNDNHYFAKHSIVESKGSSTGFTLAFNKPITIEAKTAMNYESPVIKESENVTQSDVDKFIDTFSGKDKEIVSYICSKWGVMKCETAVAVAQSENFWNKTKSFQEDRFNINTNGTIDTGIYMINSIHYNKEGCSLKEITGWKANVDCAYNLYEKQGWKIWVAYNTGRFQAFTN